MGKLAETLEDAVDFLIVTALEEERDAILPTLGLQRVNPCHDSTLVVFNGSLQVEATNQDLAYRLSLICLSQMGRVDAATATSDAIRRCRPRFVILFGIAGGLSSSDVELGDVVVSDQIVDYELQKLSETKIDRRFKVRSVDARLLNFARNLPSDGRYNRLIGHVATGDKVVSISAFLEELKATWSKLIAIEMESGGAAAACEHAPERPGFLLIKGVSDLADENKNARKTLPWRKKALANAADYLHKFLLNGPVPGVSMERAREEIADLSAIRKRLLTESDSLSNIAIAAYGMIANDVSGRDLSWLKSEIRGYSAEELSSDLFPHYREVEGQLIFRVEGLPDNPIVLTDGVIPQKNEEFIPPPLSEIRDVLNRRSVGLSLAEIEEALCQDNDIVEMCFPTSVASEITDALIRTREGAPAEVLNYYAEFGTPLFLLPKSTVAKILTNVRIRLIELIDRITSKGHLKLHGGQGSVSFGTIGRNILEDPGAVIEQCKQHRQMLNKDPFVIIMWELDQQVPKNWPMSSVQVENQIAKYNYNSRTGLERVFARSCVLSN